MSNPLSKILGESSDLSSMRVVFVIGSLTILAVWAILSIRQGVPISFGAWDVGALTALVGGKDLQKYFETRASK